MLISSEACDALYKGVDSMGVVYNAAKNQFKVFIPKGNRKYKLFTYGINRYGEFAEKLAQMSFKNGIRYNDYYVIEDDITIFKVFTKHTELYRSITRTFRDHRKQASQKL